MEENKNVVANVPVKGKYSCLSNKHVVFSLFNLATFVEYFNLQVIFSSMRGLEMSLGFSPNQLSKLTMVEELALVSFIPIWGLLSETYEVKYLLALALLISGILSIILGAVSNYGLILVLHLFNGATMGSVTPSTQKYIVSRKDMNFGFAFGILHATMCTARLVSSITVTRLSTEVIFNTPGWRICLFSFGIFCILVSPFLFLIPKFHKDPARIIIPSEKKSIKSRINHMLSFLSASIRETFITRTSRILLVLLFFSDGPFVAFGFVTIFLQYLGLTDSNAGITTGLVVVGGLFGGVFGGLTTDYFHKKSPKYGRLIFGSLSVLVRIATFLLAFSLVTIDNMERLYPLVVVCLFLNGMTFMTVSCIDRAILADVIMPNYQSSAIAISRCVAGVASSLVFNPLMGVLTENLYGYQPIQMDLKHVPKGLIEKNAYALRNSIMIISLSTTCIVFLLYIVLCISFGRDAAWIKHRIASREERKLEDLYSTTSEEARNYHSAFKADKDDLLSVIQHLTFSMSTNCNKDLNLIIFTTCEVKAFSSKCCDSIREWLLLASTTFTPKPSINFTEINVITSDIPTITQLLQYDGVILTGSFSSIGENKPWMQKLCNTIRLCFLNEIPIYGVCFGFQIISYAFGSSFMVAPYGYNFGCLEYNLTDDALSLITPHVEHLIRENSASGLVSGDVSVHIPPDISPARIVFKSDENLKGNSFGLANKQYAIFSHNDIVTSLPNVSNIEFWDTPEHEKKDISENLSDMVAINIGSNKIAPVLGLILGNKKKKFMLSVQAHPEFDAPSGNIESAKY
ncbi:conserved hypothetical protein [Theileria equi strain WA]|uniref:Major facilitator superfamily (MFS) profile domain-containing protein n=1 Tax=Theileria equi strain WA TaxID=1537102 RepID=L1LFZ8_THEEQ|nr:conserved hypothetical protein [Theileria equi strain WA]EKX74261.1 conserved hypothetical protein [Theileria equi strain WA]|eukprot:XP_004833713.1 conserved hypothetical protein [Theileria equi strain WA]